MAITFLDSFDLHTFTGHLGAGGTQDYGKYWFTSAINGVLSYSTGHLWGRALRVGWNLTGLQVTGRYSTANTVPANIQTYVMGFHARWNLTQQNPSANYAIFVGVDRGTNYVLEMNGQGNVRLRVDGSLVGSPVAAMTNDYQWFEIEITPAGSYRLSRNGVTILQHNTTAPTIGVRPEVRLGIPGTSLQPKSWWNLDHVYMGSETLIGRSGVIAVSVAASMDRMDTTNGSLRGNLIIGGQSYQTTADTVPSSSQAAFGNPNYSGVLYMTYPVNPATNDPWEAEDIIDGWGVCTSNLNGTNSMRMTGSALQVLRFVEGAPVIETITPTSAFQLSGPWVKTDEDLSYAGHVMDSPRPASYDDDEWLEIDDLGCILFRSTSDVPILQGIGITFAEEFRVDHKDWVTVDGAGTSYESYFIGGFGVFGEGNKKTQGNYITVNYETTPGGGAYLQAIWDYALDPNTGRWSQRQQVYGPKSASEYKHAHAKLKLRGHGKTLQIKVSNFHDSPFILNGYSMLVTSTTAV